MQGSLEGLEAETALLWAWGCEGIVEEGDEVVAYFSEAVELPLPGHWESVDETDWVAAYYAELQPVVLERLIVAPTHCEVATTPGQRVIRLDPGLAFGTGHHETTRLALSALSGLELSNKRVLDVGTGSGILAIAADLSGACEAVGLDIDPATLSVAEENRALNRSRAFFAVGTLDSTFAAKSVDVLVANLYAELHVTLLPDYARVLAPGGVLLITGILGERLESVLEALPPHFADASTEKDGEWTLVRAVRGPG